MLRPLARRLEFDAPVAWALSGRAWQLLAGPVSILLIAAFLTPAQQNDWYAIGSLLAWQSFFELGLGAVLAAVAAHEWAGLHLREDGRVAGDPHALARLAALWDGGRRWFLRAAVGFAVGVGLLGAVLLARRHGFRETDWGWVGPWLLAVSGTAAALAVLPALALLTGCGQVGRVNRTTALAAVCGNLVGWSVLAAGGGLWALAATAWVRAAWEWRLRGRPFFASLGQRPGGSEASGTLSWSREVRPLQWRVAVQSVAATAAASSFVLVPFAAGAGDGVGADDPGRIGMTWAGLSALQFGGIAWLTTRMPELGRLAVTGDPAFERRWVKISAVTLAAVAAGAVTAWAVVWGLNTAGLSLADRLLPPGLTAVFAAAVVLGHAAVCLTAWARAQKMEAFVAAAVLGHGAVAAAVLLLGPRYGGAGVAWGYLAATAAVSLPAHAVRWVRVRRRAATAQSSPVSMSSTANTAAGETSNPGSSGVE